MERLEQTTTALVFADDAGALRDILTAHKDQLAQPSIFWVAYAKANRGDLNRDSLWPILGEYGMRPIGQVSVDEALVRDALPPLKKGGHPSTGGRWRGRTGPDDRWADVAASNGVSTPWPCQSS